jgi:protein O-GlcNAc transferase
MTPDRANQGTEPSSAPHRRVLHVGCGPKRQDKLHRTFQAGDWQEIRVDIDPAVQPDIVATITAMPQIPDDTVDAVWSSHNLEHLFAHEVPIALREFLRVLKPGGFVLMTMPDLQKAGEFLARGQLEEPIYQSPAGPISAIDICFGHRASIARGNEFMAHRTGFSAHTLAQKLAACGFRRIRVERKNLDLWALAFKPEVQPSPSAGVGTTGADEGETRMKAENPIIDDSPPNR